MSMVTNYLTHIKRVKRQALKTRRLAYHLVDGTHGSAEFYQTGFYKFFPGNSQHGHIVPADDLSLGPVLTSCGRPF